MSGYVPGYYPPRWKPVVIPDVRVHIANWRAFKSRTGEWPTCSVVLFVIRFVFMAIGLALFLVFLSQHSFALSPIQAPTARIWVLPILALALGLVFTVSQTGRYMLIVMTVSLSIIFFLNHDFYAGRTMLVVVLVTTFAAVWGLFEQSVWNRELRKKRISSNQDVWAVTQFPSDQP